VQHQAVFLADHLSVVKQLNGLPGLGAGAADGCACCGGTTGACVAVSLGRQGNFSGIAVVTDGTVIGAAAELLTGALGGRLPWTVLAGPNVVWAAWKGLLDGDVCVGCGSPLLLLVLPLLLRLLLLLLLVDDKLGVVLAASPGLPAVSCALPTGVGGMSFMQPTFS